MKIIRPTYPRHQERVERFFRRAAEAGVQLEECAAGEPPELEFAFGGDGAVHYALPRVVASGAPLLVVPFGSGNDFACSIGLESADDSLKALVDFAAGKGNVREIDLGKVTALGNPQNTGPHYYCCVAGVGMDAQANITANAMPAWLRGHGGYIIAALKAIALFASFKISLTEAAEQKEAGAAGAQAAPSGMFNAADEDVWFTVIANAPRYGDGIQIAPPAKLDDGWLDVVRVRRMPRIRLLWFFPRVFSGAHMQIAEVEHATVKSVVVRTERPLPIQGDGEYLCDTPTRIEVVERGMKVIVRTIV